jgi:hypothetical protein
LKLEEVVKFLDDGLDIRRRAWHRAGVFIRKAEDYLEKIKIPPEFSDGKAYGFAFVQGTRLFMNYGKWSIPWFCGLVDRRVNDWEFVKPRDSAVEQAGM